MALRPPNIFWVDNLVPHSFFLPEGFQAPEFCKLMYVEFNRLCHTFLINYIYVLTCILWKMRLALFELLISDVVFLTVNELIIELIELPEQHLMRNFLLSHMRPLIIRVSCVFTAVFFDLQTSFRLFLLCLYHGQ